MWVGLDIVVGGAKHSGGRGQSTQRKAFCVGGARYSNGQGLSTLGGVRHPTAGTFS